MCVYIYIYLSIYLSIDLSINTSQVRITRGEYRRVELLTGKRPPVPGLASGVGAGYMST